MFNDNWLYCNFVYFHWLDPDANTLDNAHLLFAQLITPIFYLHHVEVTDKDPASDSFSKHKCEEIYKHSYQHEWTKTETKTKTYKHTKTCMFICLRVEDESYYW